MFNGMKFDSFTLNNDLQVLTVSDDRFVKSSAALAVMAGSMQNPDEHLGLAHFLEHMLFLGTEEFPEVGEYEDFLNKNGGGHNAYTSIDHTNYFFDVAHSGFDDALRRFSRFFVCPTFDDVYVEREKNAVHSEHEKNLKEDSRREYRFLQLITDPDHPFSKFATGDKETLSKANRDVVLDFYNGHYSSNLMRLVLMSPKPAAELRKLAEQNFSDVVNKKLSQPHYGDKLFAKLDKPKLHFVESVRDHDVLKLSFSVPDDLPYWESKPTQFLAHLLGEEGEGSLLSFLKSKGLASGLETSTWWRMFHIRVHLSDLGKSKQDEILKAIFSYIELLKREGLKEYIFNERKVLAEAELKYLEPKSSMGRASQYSASMLYYPVEEFLSHYYLFHKYSPDEFKFFLEQLNVSNSQVTYFSNQKIEGEKEPYYGINYKTQDLAPELVESIESVLVYPELSYPEANPYVPDHLEMVAPPKIFQPIEEKYKSFATLFNQTDTELEIPKASLSLSFISDKIARDPKKYLLAKLYSKMKSEELNEWGYAARLAGLNYGISHGYNTITVDVSGYSQHLVDLLNDIMVDEKHSRSLTHVRIEEDTFLNLKKKIKKTLQNREFDAAYQQLLAENSHFFATASVHHNEYIEFIDEVSQKDVNEFVKSFFSQVSIRSFSYGNITGEAVKPAIDKFFATFNSSGFTESDVSNFENKYPKLPQEKLSMVFSGQNNNNAQLTLYKASEWSIENQACVDVIGKLIEQPFFTELRTHQQLGYVVAAFPTSSNGFCGIGSLIQSQTHGANDIFDRAHSFLSQLFTELPSVINDEDLKLIKGAIISEITQVPNSLGERLSRFTMLAGTYHGDFQFLDKLAKRIEKISKETLVNFIKNHLNLQADKAPVLALLYGGLGSEKAKTPESFKEVEDYQSFISSTERIQPYKGSKDLN